MFDVIAIGGATRDITFVTDRGRVIETPENPTEQCLLGFEHGAKIHSDEVRMNFGGGACNAAATFAKMGLRAAVCAGVGDDENGKAILDNLRAQGVDTGLVQVNPGQYSGFSFVIVDGGGCGERVIFVHKGAASDLRIEPEKLAGKWLYLSSLVGSWEEDLAMVVRATAGGAKLAWNPGQAQLAAGREKLAPALGVASIFIINKDEAIELVQKAGELAEQELNDPLQLLRVLKSWGPEAVVLTDGKQGAWLAAPEASYRAPAVVDAQVDTTGAGDAFGSGLVAGYILTGSWEQALRFGVLNSGSKVTQCGAQNGILTCAQAEAGADRVAVEKIS